MTTPTQAITADEREELRRKVNAVGGRYSRMTVPVEEVEALLNALDEADKRIAELESRHARDLKEVLTTRTGECG